MSSDSTGFVVGLICGATITFVIFASLESGRLSDFKQEGIDQGHAEYVITDPATGETEWRWK